MALWRRLAAAAIGGLMVVSQGMTALAVEDMTEGMAGDALKDAIVEEETEQPAQGAGMNVSLPEGSGGSIKDGIAESFALGAGADMSGVMGGTESGVSGDTLTLSDIYLQMVMPDQALLVEPENVDFFYYIYPTGQEGIPELIVGANKYSNGEENFLTDYTQYMLGNRPQLTVAEEESTVTIGDKTMRKIVYQYPVDGGYTVVDTRYSWYAGDDIYYMFAKRECPEVGLTVGTMLEDMITTAQSSLYEPSTAPQPDTTAQTDAAPQPDTAAQTDAPQVSTAGGSALEPVKNEDSSWTVTTEYYTMTIPPAWTGHFEANKLDGAYDSGYVLQVVNTESKDAGYGGEIFSFALIPQGEDYSYLPSYDELGTMTTPDGVFSVVVTYPTDVQTGDVWQEFYNIFYGDKNSAISSVLPVDGVTWTLPNGKEVAAGSGSAGQTSETAAQTTVETTAQTTAETTTQTTVPTTAPVSAGNLMGTHEGSTYKNDAFGFSYTVPSDWIMANADQLATLNESVGVPTGSDYAAEIEKGTAVCVSYAQSSDGMNIMNVVIQSWGPYMTEAYDLTQEDMEGVLGETVKGTVSELSSLGAEVTGSSVNPITFMGQNCFAAEVTFNYEGYSGIQKQIAVPAGAVTALITVRTVDGDNTQQMMGMFQAS